MSSTSNAIDKYGCRIIGETRCETTGNTREQDWFSAGLSRLVMCYWGQLNGNYQVLDGVLT